MINAFPFRQAHAALRIPLSATLAFALTIGGALPLLADRLNFILVIIITNCLSA